MGTIKSVSLEEDIVSQRTTMECLQIFNIAKFRSCLLDSDILMWEVEFSPPHRWGTYPIVGLLLELLKISFAFCSLHSKHCSSSPHRRLKCNRYKLTIAIPRGIWGSCSFLHFFLSIWL